MGFNDYSSIKSGAIKIDDTSKEGITLQKHANLRPDKLEYIPPKSVHNYVWNRKMRWLAAYVVLLIAFCTVFSWPTKYYDFKFEHGFAALEQKPGSIASYDKDGNLTGFSRESDACNRTVFIDPSNMTQTEILEAAYLLYSIGNIGMLTADQSAYYSEGNADSLLLGMNMPLKFSIIDIRNNLTGEAFRERIQLTNENAETGKTIKLIMGLAPSFGFDLEVGERRYYKAGDESVLNGRSVTFNNDTGNKIIDWDTVSILPEKNKDRADRLVIPIPYSSAAYKGTDLQLDSSDTIGEKSMYYDTIGSLYGTKFNAYFGDITNVKIPIYRDCQDIDSLGGRLITYEKTDQHIYYDSSVDTEYNNISSAEISYDADGEFYTIKMSLDCTVDDSGNGYTCADTSWALRDSQGCGDPVAAFTKIDIEFQLWDNGYFKQWKMYEEWHTDKGTVGAMGAKQNYLEKFTYFKDDCDLARFDFWTQQAA